MGLESYFMHLVPEGVTWLDHPGLEESGFHGHSAVQSSLIRETIKAALAGRSAPAIPGVSSAQSEKLVVDEAIEVWIDDEDGYFQKATLAGCFAYYDEGLSLCYRIACLIGQHAPVRLFFQSTGFMPLGEEQAFIGAVRENHQDKHQAFLETFGDIRAKTLPNGDFFDFYHSLGNPWKSLLRSLKHLWRARKSARAGGFPRGEAHER